MKLRNKKTGEIADSMMYSHVTKTFVVYNSNAEITIKKDESIANYNSLADLCDEWEDYEEPKEEWVIDISEYDGVSKVGFGFPFDDIDRAKEFGIWFETKEEAEQVVEKLKAWKRLKDAGFKFTGVDTSWQTRQHDCGTISFCIDSSQADKHADDIELLFSGGDDARH